MDRLDCMERVAKKDKILHAFSGTIFSWPILLCSTRRHSPPPPLPRNPKIVSIFTHVWQMLSICRALCLFLAVTVLLGVNGSSLDDGFRSSQTVVVVVWLAFIVLWEILLEILSCCAKSTSFFWAVSCCYVWWLAKSPYCLDFCF